jgi:hypothetical protein
MAEIRQGLLSDVLINTRTVTPVDGALFDVLVKIPFDTTTIVPIAYMHFFDGSVTATLPIYDPADITNNQLRIFTGSATGCFDLVALNDSASSGIRIYNGIDILCIRKVT